MAFNFTHTASLFNLVQGIIYILILLPVVSHEAELALHLSTTSLDPLLSIYSPSKLPSSGSLMFHSCGFTLVAQQFGGLLLDATCSCLYSLLTCRSIYDQVGLLLASSTNAILRGVDTSSSKAYCIAYRNGIKVVQGTTPCQYTHAAVLSDSFCRRKQLVGPEPHFRQRVVGHLYLLDRFQIYPFHGSQLRECIFRAVIDTFGIPMRQLERGFESAQDGSDGSEALINLRTNEDS